MNVLDRTCQVLGEMIRVMEGLKDSQFNIDSWRSSCGSTACVLGWCAQDEWFNGQGFFWDTVNKRPGLVADNHNFRGLEAFSYMICGNEWTYEDVGSYLFMESSYPHNKDWSEVYASREQVIERLRMVLRYLENGRNGGSFEPNLNSMIAISLDRIIASSVS